MSANLAAVANDLAGYDESSLIELLGIRAKAISGDFAIAGKLAPEVTYDAKFAGPLDEVRALGQRILNKWNKELFSIVCGSSGDDKEDRTKILNALSLSEGAAIAALIPILTALGLAPALATILAAIVVKRFLGTAMSEICSSWKKQVDA